MLTADLLRSTGYKYTLKVIYAKYFVKKKLSFHDICFSYSFIAFIKFMQMSSKNEANLYTEYVKKQ